MQGAVVISKLSNDNGVVVSNKYDLCQLSKNYFKFHYACNEINIDATIETYILKYSFYFYF